MDVERPDIALGVPEPAASGLWRDALRELRHKRSAVVGAAMLMVLVALAVFAPLIAPYPTTGEEAVFFDEDIRPREPPCIHLLGCDQEKSQHLMGIDSNGRDMFSRWVYGSRISLRVGFTSVVLAVMSGTLIGLVAGFFGGITDNVLMRIMDVLLAFPALLLAIAIVTIIGPGLNNAIIAISVVTIPAYARIVRSSVLTVREMDFVMADRALGVGSWRLIFHRILPNSLTPLVVQATLGVGTAVLETAALGFVGLGVQPPIPEWGSMLAGERAYVFTAPHLVVFPGLAIMWNVLAFNLLGDGLRDALDPRLNR
jgi:peptide/nickel transport system permease protein